MAYVTARRNGRFEIRESLHTPNGPRAHTLAGFTKVLTDEALAKAHKRATRPFDQAAVVASARRAGARVNATESPEERSVQPFLAASRRMADTLRRTATAPATRSPGEVLIDLLGFADAVATSQPPRASERLAFPPLTRLLASRPAGAGAS
jgi:uncharacterized iron-regulated membrane protein